MRRVLVTAVVAAAGLVTVGLVTVGLRSAGLLAAGLVTAGPAAGSSASGSPDARYYRSSVVGIEPATPGLQVTVLTNGESVTVENRSGQEVVVLGYGGEAYLRFDGRGVDENVDALSAQLNAGQVPKQQGRPVVTWKHRSDEPRYTWRDLRVRWTVTQRPPIVDADEHATHRVVDWAIPVTIGGRPGLVRGAVDWTGTPRVAASTVASLGAGGCAVVLGAATAFLILRRRRRGRRGSQDPGITPCDERVLVGALAPPSGRRRR